MSENPVDKMYYQQAIRAIEFGEWLIQQGRTMINVINKRYAQEHKKTDAELDAIAYRCENR